MRKIVLTAALLCFVASTAFSAAFQPTVLKLTAPAAIKYAFDGKTLSIPVTATGTPADVSFLVFTNNMGSKVSNVTNGYLGWHFVNRIDTCLYMSATNAVDKGTTTNINWDGKMKNGGPAVPAGTYTYYLFGYDNKSPKVQMTKQISTSPWNYHTILEKDAKGLPMAAPVMYMGDGVRTTATGGKSITVDYNHTSKRWVIGNDPLDATLLETCVTTGLVDVGGLAFLPTDQTVFFHDTLRNNGNKVTKKWKWVPNGPAVLDTNWGDNGEFVYATACPAGWNFGPGVVSDGKDYLLVTNNDMSGVGKESKMILVDVTDGSEFKRVDMTNWWTNLAEGDPAIGGQYTGGPTAFSFRNGLVALGSHSTCVNSVMDVYQAKTADSFLWVNKNGDYVGDHNWEVAAKHPWLCNDYVVGPYKYTMSMDNQGFCIFPSYDMGAVSFGLYAPDGTGISYKAYAGEVAKQKYGCEFIDYASPFDGIYSSASADPTSGAIAAGIWYVGHDSFKGIISNVVVGVEEAAPSAFAVAQNSPNPFNPTTSINFTLAKAGKVTVDVFNAAGQKVDTIVNTTMNQGAHSVTWNASKFSAGVYFYTVNSGNMSKTMKMTLLK